MRRIQGLRAFWCFTTLVQADFSSATAGGNAESYLDQFGLQISDYPVDEKNAISHYFSPDNVALGAGSVDLTVRAYDGGEYVYGAEIVTADTTLYGSLRTVLKSSTTGGVCEGMFFYLPFDFDPSEDYHEYRIDWTESSTTFYVDGVQKVQHTTNVPYLATLGVWNVWSNGDPYWSAGPPTADSVTHIRSIEMYSGYAKEVEGTVCDV
ncbi:hypothetical protein BD626DRAFT_546288 [Schizophyllum amplum]|uniref:GH16 domain-containing protein n=1 Tax=Schizophyllum amplum TaxID=97359 RepID=A0A550CM15_9AGAR|nr:hypothetical protein BD626DRAFT_546288 [Auriculariopsis ampla]